MKHVLIFLILCSFCYGINAIASGDWNTAETWAGGDIPSANGETAYIGAAYTVTLNTDLSGVTLGAIDIDGTLNCATTATAYLKTNANITGAGTINCGSSGTVLPYTRLMTFDFAGTAYGFNESTLALNFYCWQPARLFTTLSGAEAAGQTELSVSHDLQADWGAFDTAYVAATGGTHASVYVCDVAGSLPDAELETIASIAAGTITTSSIDADKASGSYVILITRNIRVINSTSYAVNAAKDASVLGCEINCTRGVSGGNNHTISGSIVTTVYNINGGYGHNITGVLVGNGAGMNNSTCPKFSGILAGITNGVYICVGAVVQGYIVGCTYGIRQSSGYCYNSNLNNATDILYSDVKTFNTQFLGTTENSGYLLFPSTYSFSKNHDGVAGDFIAWSGGGYIEDTSTVLPSGFSKAFIHYCETASYPCIRQEEILVDSGKPLTIRGYFLLHDEFTIAPKLELLAADGITVLDTDSVDILDNTTTWQLVNVSWENTASYPQTVIIKASAQNTTGTYLVEAWEDRSYIKDPQPRRLTGTKYIKGN